MLPQQVARKINGRVDYRVTISRILSYLCFHRSILSVNGGWDSRRDSGGRGPRLSRRAVFAKIVNLCRCTRALARCHFIFVLAWLRREELVRNAWPPHYLFPIAYPRFPPPFLFVAVDGISCQLELDLSNPRVIAPRSTLFFFRSGHPSPFPALLFVCVLLNEFH